MSVSQTTCVAIVGGGFTALAAAYELARAGVAVTILETELEIGGLAAAFDAGGSKLERFYHHWFTNDLDVMQLIADLGLSDHLLISSTSTGVYYSNTILKLSTPLDLVRFTPLSFADRIRLGLLTLRARRIRNWRELEHKTAAQWLTQMGGENVFRVVWEPLLKGKFGPTADQVSAVWFWNKLKLRGGSRGKRGEERLVYFRGGFAALARALAGEITRLGGRIETNAGVSAIRPVGDRWQLVSHAGRVIADQVIVTPALPLVADMIEDWAPAEYRAQLRRINYLANVCLVLELDRSLSSTYWLNVNDPSFPFVAVIEHTNFERPQSYGGRHIVYLSKYLPHSDPVYAMSAQEVLEYAYPYLRRMFPRLERDWIKQHHLWKARWAQPVVERHYSRLVPQQSGPLPGWHLCSMAQIYPEDRGTNYAIREGRRVGREVARSIASSPVRTERA